MTSCCIVLHRWHCTSTHYMVFQMTLRSKGHYVSTSDNVFHCASTEDLVVHCSWTSDIVFHCVSVCFNTWHCVSLCFEWCCASIDDIVSNQPVFQWRTSCVFVFNRMTLCFIQFEFHCASANHVVFQQAWHCVSNDLMSHGVSPNDLVYHCVSTNAIAFQFTLCLIVFQ